MFGAPGVPGILGRALVEYAAVICCFFHSNCSCSCFPHRAEWAKLTLTDVSVLEYGDLKGPVLPEPERLRVVGPQKGARPHDGQAGKEDMSSDKTTHSGEGWPCRNSNPRGIWMVDGSRHPSTKRRNHRIKGGVYHLKLRLQSLEGFPSQHPRALASAWSLCISRPCGQGKPLVPTHEGTCTAKARYLDAAA